MQLALIVFAIVMFAFPLGWTQLGFVIHPYLVGIILGAIGSFSIGVFFTIPYAFPAQVAAVDAEETGKDRVGMFFAVQGVLNSFIGSLAGSILVLIWANLPMKLSITLERKDLWGRMAPVPYFCR